MKKKREIKNFKIDALLSSKANFLRKTIRNLGKVAVAFSGGIDSTFLLKVAQEELGENVFAITGNSLLIPEEELHSTCQIANSFGASHSLIEIGVLTNSAFCQNPPERCYICKHVLFEKIQAIAYEKGIPIVIEASNFDDHSDFRPGIRALQEKGIKSPLMEAKLTKKEVRRLARAVGIPNWDKPSQACLASRFPYGEKITIEKIKKVAEAEKFIRELGFRQVRVRSYDNNNLARIEVENKDIGKFINPEIRKKIIDKLKFLGFIYLTFDLEGYRSGSMNKILGY
ncbi:MAG: ATP-dependent sacrificial sulfur transferase LarE [Desulfobacterota bacterium]|nr:ATP-dependent sacrificial sulfur transferase LarE [Thermodesulfobacteriota bacterium]